MVLFITLHRVVLTSEPVDEILRCDVQMKATEQNFPVVHNSIMLYEVVLTLRSEDEIRLSDPKIN